MAGAGELAFGIVLVVIFFITLTVASIPFIWIGALVFGIILIVSGIYHMAQSAANPQRLAYPYPPQPQFQPGAWYCRKCGKLNAGNHRFCDNCGFSPETGNPTAAATP